MGIRGASKTNRGKWVIGLMSGTSADGVDAALVRITGSGGATKCRLAAWETYPYRREVREAVLRAATPGKASTAEVSGLNFLLGEIFARACRRISQKSGIPLGRIDLIGSHGQTLFHNPDPRHGGTIHIRSTLQVGEPCVIAERTGVTTVADFRTRDVAAGGEGAPLSPLLHSLLFRRRSGPVAVLNLGGICNVTRVPKKGNASPVMAFDTGPANVLIDLGVNFITHGKKGFDPGGRFASGGVPDPVLIRSWLRHSYFKKSPPKSTGREEFGPLLFARMTRQAEKRKVRGADLLATLTRFTAESIAGSLHRFFPPESACEEVILCGGGVQNRTLVSHLRALLHPIPVTTTDDHGYSSRALEAVLMALLAYETACGRPGNLPMATGASRPVILGKIVPGSRPGRRG